MLLIHYTYSPNVCPQSQSITKEKNFGNAMKCKKKGKKQQCHVYFRIKFNNVEEMDQGLSMLGFMHELQTIQIVNMTYTRSQSYTNMMVDEHIRLQMFKVVVVVFFFFLCCRLIFCSHKCTPLIISTQLNYPNILKYQLIVDHLECQQCIIILL